MHGPRRLLFLQLPRLDPDVTMPGENAMLAAAGLQTALERSREAPRWRVAPTPAAQDAAGNAALLEAIARAAPNVVAATLYLWNVERTLRLLAALKRRLPGLRTVVGGPEVCRDHPLLEHAAGADVAVIGEGETVFPSLLAALRRGRETDWQTVGWRRGRGRAWGRRPPPCRPLAELLPAADHPVCRPDRHGMASLETSRGCPLRCAFCCYNLRRRAWSGLAPAEVGRRIRALRRRGAREIRLVDPTFNAHPRFRAVLGAMRRANPGRRIRFFVEIRADTLTDADAAALAAAGVAEAEVGVQSTDPGVLRRIRRPADLGRVRRGLEALERHGIRPTIDFLYGLPGQGPEDIAAALRWLAAFPKAHAQILPLLLLPGTELRDRRRALGLRAQRLPPYRVVATRLLGRRRMAALERRAERQLGGFDAPTRRFVGTRLPDLFQAPGGRRQAPGDGCQVSGVESPDSALRTPHSALRTLAAAAAANRRTVFFAGDDLYAQRRAIVAAMRAAVAAEPDILWQFVLAPSREEPLDLLDAMIAAVRRLPPHWLDRLVSPADRRRFASRRVFVRLPAGRRFDPEWRAEAEQLLSYAFH
jgi:hypothetical protein